MWKRLIGVAFVIATALVNYYCPDLGETLAPVLPIPATAPPHDSSIDELVFSLPHAAPVTAPASEPAPSPAPSTPPKADVRVQVRIPTAYSPQPRDVCDDRVCPIEPSREIRFIGRVEEAVGVPATVRMLHDGSLRKMEIRLVPGSWVTESPVAPGEVPAFQ